MEVAAPATLPSGGVPAGGVGFCGLRAPSKDENSLVNGPGVSSAGPRIGTAEWCQAAAILAREAESPVRACDSGAASGMALNRPDTPNGTALWEAVGAEDRAHPEIVSFGNSSVTTYA